MSPVWGQIAGFVTVAVMLTFIAIWIWAWMPRHRNAFAALAEIPMHDDPAPAIAEQRVSQ